MTDLNRLLANIARLGTIAELDTAARKVKVSTGNNITGWLAWPAEIGANYVRWRPLRLGAQVLLLCPSGDISQGHIVGHIFTDDLQPIATDATVDVVEFTDGTTIEYDSAAHALTVNCVGAVNVNGNEVNFNGGGSGGVVCQNHVCAITNSAHPQGSLTVKGGD